MSFRDEDLTFLWPKEPRIDSLWEVAAREFREATGLISSDGIIRHTLRSVCCGSLGPYSRWCTRKKAHTGPHVAGPDDPFDYVIWEVIKVPHERLGCSYENRILDERA